MFDDYFLRDHYLFNSKLLDEAGTWKGFGAPLTLWYKAGYETRHDLDQWKSNWKTGMKQGVWNKVWNACLFHTLFHTWINARSHIYIYNIYPIIPVTLRRKGLHGSFYSIETSLGSLQLHWISDRFLGFAIIKLDWHRNSDFRQNWIP